MKILALFSMILFICSVHAQVLNIPLVNVQGASVIYIEPDEILLSITIEKSATNIKTARSLNENISAQVFNYLSSNGIEKENIQTQYFIVKKDYAKQNEFYASHKIYICLKDVTKFDVISDGLLAFDINEVGEPQYRNSKLIEIKNKARKKAIIDARNKAKLLASELGQKIGKAKFIKEINQRSTRNTSEQSNNIELDFGSSNSSFVFAPDQIEVRALVEVSFELLD